MVKYKWKPTGIGVVDNLGVQFAKVIRGANQGSISSRHTILQLVNAL